MKSLQNKTIPILLKKITTNTVEEHFSETQKMKASAAFGFVNNDYAQENEEDSIKLNVPLMIRLLEYAREEVETDVDLHIVLENLIELSEYGDVLEMKDYPAIIKITSED